MTSSRTTRVLVRLVVATVLIGVGAAASATFPGKNGRIAFNEAGNIFTMNSDGSDVRQITFFGPDPLACCQAWSPDGQRLVFVVHAADFSAIQLWIMNADGSNQHLLLDDPAHIDVLPSFSPDGGHVVFSHCLPSFQCGISRVRSDGTDLTEITGIDPNPDVSDFDAQYSPDGQTIAFSSLTRDGLLQAAYLMNPDGSNIRLLTPPALGALKPDWSPDAERLVFTTEFQYQGFPCLPNPAIWLIDTDGSDPEPLTHSPKTIDTVPSWAPQGDAIAFERDTSTGQTAIYVLDLGQGGNVPRLIREGSSTRRLAMPPAGAQSGRIRAPSRRLRAIQEGGTFPRWGPAS